MTLMLTTTDVAMLVERMGIAKTLDVLSQYIQNDFIRWESFEKTPRLASHSQVGVIELMPTTDADHYSFKFVNGHPSNPAQGLPTVMAFGALAEVSTGTPLLLSELTLTTALRTAATSIMAARVLARPGARTMALIGNGAQSEFQALAFHHLLGIDTLFIHDVDPEASHKLMANLACCRGLDIRLADSTRAAVADADIITTVTADKTNALILTPEMIRPGVHINAVGGDCPGKTELHADILSRATTFVEFEPQSRIEGEIQQMPADYDVVPLWEVVAGKRPGRQSDTEITVFDSVGFALEDFSALHFLWDQARAFGIGRPMELVPEGNPKDLLGTMRRLSAGLSDGAVMGAGTTEQVLAEPDHAHSI
ncbi:ornithine cyclodeaminase [Castellaniella sp.]|uniref:ornithine cyclodeaminase n=1 Tax=Castellaniella sp. TaxID=1955812 RepID=UPI002AFDCD62|nr:ornithine cyclodeaminase [Castellaniella sp.]